MLCGYFDEDELLTAIETHSEKGDLWDVCINGRLEFYFEVN